MREVTEISKQGKQVIQDFIQALAIHEDLNPKTLKEYVSDLKNFINWFETTDQQKELFQVENVATPTLTRYRNAMQKMLIYTTSLITPQWRSGRSSALPYPPLW